MEELDDENNAIINENARKITIKASEIITKFRSYKDRELFRNELSKLYIM